MYNFKFADIGEGIHEGVILKWMFKVGDSIKDGDTLCIVETDKVNAEIPSPVNGKIAELLFKVGDTIHVGDVIVKIDDGSGTAEKKTTGDVSMLSDNTNESVSENDGESAGVIGEIKVSSEVIESSTEGTINQKTTNKEKALATPVARKLAKDLGVDINTIKGSGIVGRVMKEDILKSIEEKIQVEKEPVMSTIKAPKLDFNGDIERVKISKLRKTIAQNMVLSKTIIPHVTSMDEFDVTELVELRKKHKEIAAEQGVNLTYLPFIVKALTLTLKEHRIINSSFDMEQEEIIYKNFYNIGIAVDTIDGLIVPVIKNADKLGIIEIAKEIQQISEQARNRTIPLDKLQNGTFTITNYGATGSSYGVTVIRYPESAILGTGLIVKKPVVINDEIVIRSIMPISVSYDHRIIDGGDAGRFLMRLKQYLSNPMLLLLS
ncbi:MAG: dihydrolipoamide acyltransferase [Haloplasmataceae bacterium]|jgi:pyruvate dehydrogenase E2 component (dihydrolipoamide acetyltransferase)|nr:dihydrolipoamide acyltransferase [Haloplasmataceae bacterium]